MLEELFLVLLGSVFAPEMGYARVVHPFVEVFGVGEADGKGCCCWDWGIGDRGKAPVWGCCL